MPNKQNPTWIAWHHFISDAFATTRPLVVTVLAVSIILGIPAHGIVIEAEKAAKIGFPATVVSDDRASGGYCVNLGGGLGRNLPGEGVGTRKGEVVFEIEIKEPGFHQIWVRVKWHCTCSRILRLTTSGTTVNERKRRTFDVAESMVWDDGSPRVWRWVKCSEVDFHRGSNEIRIEQFGHLALLDQVCFVTDPDDLPAGISEESRVFCLSSAESFNSTANGNQVTQSIGDEEWGNFRLDAALGLPPDFQEQNACSAWIAFCCRESIGAYELHITRTNNDRIAVRLLRASRTNRVQLCDCVTHDGRDYFHHVRLTKIGDEIMVELDGNVSFRAHDDTFPSGTLSLNATDPRGVRIEQIGIQEMDECAEFFDTDERWTPLSGRWRVAAEEQGITMGNYYCGAGIPTALSICPWGLGDRYEIGAGVKLSTGGSAGIAFNVVDASNFSALVLDSGGNGSSGQVDLQVLNRKDGQAKVLWKSQFLHKVDQWIPLSLERKAGSIHFFPASATKTRLVDEAFTQRGGTGLFVGDNGFASFSDVRAKPFLADWDALYLFEENSGLRDLCHWVRRLGDFVLSDHDRLMCLPREDRGEFVLELRRDLPPACRIDVGTYENRDLELEPEAGDFGSLPKIQLPLLPDDPRVGFSLTLEEGATEYSMSLNVKEMSHPIIARNGEVLVSNNAPRSRTDRKRNFFVELSRGRLVFGSGRSVRATVEAEDLRGYEAGKRIAVVGKNVLRENPVTITFIDLRQLYTEDLLQGWTTTKATSTVSQPVNGESR